MPPERTPLPFWTQVGDLLLVEITNWRWSWRSMVLLSIIAPLLSMLGLSVFARDAGLNALSYVLTGNIVLALMFGTMDKVQSHFMFMRMMGTLDYFATLPIRKQALILAVLLAFFVLALPSVLVTILVGAWLLHIPLTVHPIILLIIPISTLPLSGIGALIGTTARTPAEGGTLSTLLTLVMLGIGPVIIPPDRLPDWLVWLGRLSPATYAASAMRQALLGPISWRIGLDCIVLLGLGMIVVWAAGGKMDWRQK
ncbi:MAG: ABC transporter permease [Anaerolineales bacterium]|nr:ABC transporter permease [Anaerolineales bacterium]